MSERSVSAPLSGASLASFALDFSHMLSESESSPSARDSGKGPVRSALFRFMRRMGSGSSTEASMRPGEEGVDDG